MVCYLSANLRPQQIKFDFDMKLNLCIGLLFILGSKSFSQNLNTNRDSTLNDSIRYFNLVVEHYNFSDTANNEFAAYLIRSRFISHKIRMEELKEVPLTSSIKGEKFLFRMLSLPSFNHPICFTISNKKNQFYLHWTVGKGAGGYEPKGVKKKCKVKISKKDWDYFQQLIDVAYIDSLSLVSYLLMTDGTLWIIEKNIDSSYKIHFTNIVWHGIEDGFALLLHISRIKSNQPIQFYNNEEIGLFDKNNRLIDLRPIRENILANLNESFHDKLLNEDYCFDCGLYIKINSHEKVKSVKYIPDMLPHRTFEDRFEYFAENFIDWKFRRTVKRSLKKIDFKVLNLSNKIWIPVYIKYNESKKVLELDNSIK